MQPRVANLSNTSFFLVLVFFFSSNLSGLVHITIRLGAKKEGANGRATDGSHTYSITFIYFIPLPISVFMISPAAGEMSTLCYLTITCR